MKKEKNVCVVYRQLSTYMVWYDNGLVRHKSVVFFCIPFILLFSPPELLLLYTKKERTPTH